MGWNEVKTTFIEESAMMKNIQGWLLVRNKVWTTSLEESAMVIGHCAICHCFEVFEFGNELWKSFKVFPAWLSNFIVSIFFL